MKNLKRLIFDADDTLWQNNIHYEKASGDFFKLCARHGLEQKVVIKEFEELELYIVNKQGYASENYVWVLNELFNSFLSEFNDENINQDFYNIVEEFRQHTHRKPMLVADVKHTLKTLSSKYEMYILTKGEVTEQSRKIRNSGLQEFFIENFIVPEKNAETYSTILQSHNWKAEDCCMIGNSPKSDINPALKVGMYAVYIPYEFTWKLDNEPVHHNNEKLGIAENFRDLISLFCQPEC